MDPKVNGQLQHEWGWYVAAYLFLGGLAGGAYTIGAVNSLMGDGLSAGVGLGLSFPAILIGCLCLLADLGSPSRAILAGMKPGTSWIARGTWIITAFMILNFLHLYLRQAGADTATMDVIAVAGIVFAVATMAYTGILLGASKGIPFWRSGIVPVVFIVSALVTGHFAIMLFIAWHAAPGLVQTALQTMAREAVVLVALEVLAIVLFLQAAFRQPDSRESAERILRKRLFVFGYVILGLAAPLALMLQVMASAPEPARVILGALLGLAGGLILRQSVLACGALPTLNMAGFEFRRIHRPKTPKPGVGLLPPQ